MSNIKYKIGDKAIYYQIVQDQKPLINGRKYTIENVGFYTKEINKTVYAIQPEYKHTVSWHNQENFISEKEYRKLKLKKINENVL